MDKEKLEERFQFHNPWWVTGQVPTALLPKFKRHIFPKLVSYLSLERILMLKGPRRTGKSTLFYQIIDFLQKEKKVSPQNLFYLTFDDPLLRADLFEILKLYEKIVGSSLEEMPLKYIFLDEVQFLTNWASLVKIFFDRKLKVKFLVSGSSASLLIKQSESLSGRTIEETLLPMSFAEWVDYYAQTSSVFGSSQEILFQKYLEKSGFLHLLTVDDREIWTRMLIEDVVTKAIYKDSVEIFGLREPAILEKLFAYLASSTSGLVNQVKLASMLGIDRIQVGKYLTFLENTLLVFPLLKYSRQIRESIRSQEKIHLIDQGFNQIYPASDGAKLESIVARHLWEKFGKDTYFWRERGEVDLVLDRKKYLLPIEIKNTSKVEKKDLSGVISFCQKFKQKQAVVVYKGARCKKVYLGINFAFYPIWEFLLSFDKLSHPETAL